MFLSVVFLICFVVYGYISFYIGFNSCDYLYFFKVTLFVVSIFFLVFSCSLFGLILGWDLLGLSSLLLIIYYRDIISYISGFFTFFFNRVGDGIIMMSFYFIYYYGSFMVLGFR